MVRNRAFHFFFLSFIRSFIRTCGRRGFPVTKTIAAGMIGESIIIAEVAVKSTAAARRYCVGEEFLFASA